MSKTLTMNFLTSGGKKASLRVSNVKDDLSQDEVKAAMNTIVAKNIFAPKGGDITSVDSAAITDRTSTQLQVK